MKAYIISLLVVFSGVVTSCAQKTAETAELNDNKKEKKEKMNCRAFKNGHFIVKEGMYGHEFVVRRQGKFQVETDQYGTMLTFNVDWTDKCSYILTLEDIQNLENNPTNPDWKEGQVLTVNIIETSPESYKQISSSNFDNVTFVTDMQVIDAATFNKRMAEIGAEVQ